MRMGYLQAKFLCPRWKETVNYKAEVTLVTDRKKKVLVIINPKRVVLFFTKAVFLKGVMLCFLLQWPLFLSFERERRPGDRAWM